MKSYTLDKKTLVTVIVVIATAVAAPSALAATTVAHANGNDVILPDGSVYEFGDDGFYHLIPDVTTANAMGLDWNNLTVADELDGDVGDSYAAVVNRSPLGLDAPAASAAPALPQANGNDVILPDGSVYESDDDGVYHAIPDVATANAMHLDWDNLTVVDELDGPIGTPFPSVPS